MEKGMWERESADRRAIELPDDCIDSVDRALNPLGRFFRHAAMHAGNVPMIVDEFGRCARCVKLGLWRPDA
jgi:hypothetical protein